MLLRLLNAQSCKRASVNAVFTSGRVARAAGILRGNSTLSKRPLDDLHYHLMNAPSDLQHWTKSVFAVSYLSDPPVKLENSKTILGIIPALEEEEAGLNDFKENAKFIDLMHETVQAALVDGVDDVIQAEALQRGSGWLHIHDERNVPALGRIGDPDDILGSVRVEDGKILPETYQRMPSYRLFTADGPPKLSAGLAKRLEEALLRQQKEENEA